MSIYTDFLTLNNFEKQEKMAQINNSVVVSSVFLNFYETNSFSDVKVENQGLDKEDEFRIGYTKTGGALRFQMIERTGDITLEKKQYSGWTVGWMDGWTGGWVDWGMGGQGDGWTDGWTDGWMDGWVN